MNVECTVSEIHGLVALPGTAPLISSETYVCTTDTGSALFFDDDIPALLGEGYAPGETKLSLVPNTISSDGIISVQLQGSLIAKECYITIKIRRRPLYGRALDIIVMSDGEQS